MLVPVYLPGEGMYEVAPCFVCFVKTAPFEQKIIQTTHLLLNIKALQFYILPVSHVLFEK